MAQTDRQTDKASHWKTAVFDKDDNWARLDGKPPDFVRAIHMQTEICPETQAPHRQIHVECNRQVRLSQMTGWIPKVRWFAVRGKVHIENSIKYCSKKDTAVPGTQQVIQGEEYLRIHELFRVIARYATPEYVDGQRYASNSWTSITSRLIASRGVEWISKLSNPTLRRLWEDWGWIVVNEFQDWNEETGGSFIIEDPPDGDPWSDYSFLE